VAVASLIFYAWGAGADVLLLLACMVVNFSAGLLVDSERLASREQLRIVVLVTAIVFDVSVLLVFKYADFASRQLHNVDAGVTTLHYLLPVGISFYTFHHLSYVVDVYRHSRKAQRSPLQFATYIAMFPQLIAGPIVRYHEIADQLTDTKRNRFQDFADGFPRFAWGLSKKVLIADTVAPIANAVFVAHPHTLNTEAAWIGALAFTVQIYFDFSGYTDMALGMAHMFGFRLPENFSRPYSAASITDFWHRWHMSLSRWFRDYVYIPLGGNRSGERRTYLNLYLVFALVGFWHGANWTFLVWGLYHGTLLVIERITGVGRTVRDRTNVFGRTVTMLLVIVGWVLFRATSIGQAGTILHLMFVPNFAASHVVAAAANRQSALVLTLSMLVFVIPPGFVTGRWLDSSLGRRATIARLGIAAVTAPCALLIVAAGTFSPFLYYRF
jgi:alginate O-acetyltransferase complex protein AlgI